MNGRIYDPTLGRFLQADPFIQAPENSQSYNRYSYVWNNPVSATDPSGYFGIFKKIGRNIIRGASKIFGAKVVSIAGNIASLFCGPYAPACAAGWSYEYSRAMGVSSSGALRAAFTAAVTTYAFQQIGNYFNGASADNLLAAKHGIGSTTFDFGGLSLSGRQIAGQIAAHAVVGGISAELSGGKFGHGFFSAGVTKGLGGTFLPGSSELSGGDILKGTVVSMVIGGTASVFSGSKFANGANTAAFQYLLNQGSSSIAEAIKNRLPTGNLPPLPEDAKVLAKFKSMAVDATNEIDGKYPFLQTAPLRWLRGILIHSSFASRVRSMNLGYYGAVVSYLNGRVVPYGTAGSVRADAVYGIPGAPKFVIELKTGGASLTVGELINYDSHLPKGVEVYKLEERDF
ncbi:hypothetical protein OAP14_09755 [Aliiglaciecola sp.]|nr:hypothetical protein [Aliiglaciecola sp.]